jgi:hypothetical protein
MTKTSISVTATLGLPILWLLNSCGSITAVSDVVEVGLTRIVSDPRSYRMKNENVVLEIDTDGTAQSSDDVAAKAMPAFAATYLAGEVIKGAENATKNFSVSYTGSGLEYPLNKLSGFSVVRTVGNNNTEVSRLNFKVEKFKPSGYHYIYLESARIDQSKAATPWWEGTLDLVIAVRISTPAGGKDAGPVVIDADQLVVKKVKVGAGETTALKGRTRTGLFQFPEKDTPFFLQVTVQEMSNFTKVAEKGNTLIGEKKADWQKKLEAALGGGG